MLPSPPVSRCAEKYAKNQIETDSNVSSGQLPAAQPNGIQHLEIIRFNRKMHPKIWILPYRRRRSLACACCVCYVPFIHGRFVTRAPFVRYTIDRGGNSSRSWIQWEGETKKTSNDIVFMSIERARPLVDAIACCSIFSIFQLAICVRNKAVSYTTKEKKPACIRTHYEWPVTNARI